MSKKAALGFLTFIISANIFANDPRCLDKGYVDVREEMNQLQDNLISRIERNKQLLTQEVAREQELQSLETISNSINFVMSLPLTFVTWVRIDKTYENLAPMGAMYVAIIPTLLGIIAKASLENGITSDAEGKMNYIKNVIVSKSKEIQELQENILTKDQTLNSKDTKRNLDRIMNQYTKLNKHLLHVEDIAVKTINENDRWYKLNGREKALSLVTLSTITSETLLLNDQISFIQKLNSAAEVQCVFISKPFKE